MKKDENDRLVPRFPNATYIAGAEEWDAAINPDERTAAVYSPERYHALKDSGRLELIDLDHEILPGIRAVRTGGHTEGHFALKIESEGKKVFYYSDVLPMSFFIRVPYVAALDLIPRETMAVKEAMLPEVLADDVVLAFAHDNEFPLGRVRREDDRLMVTGVETKEVGA